MKIPQNLLWIKEKIKECEKQIEKNTINITTANEYMKLLEIRTELYNYLYFKLHQEETFLIK
jgi:hypothetical protein